MAIGASIDIQKLLSKLPFSTTGLNGELHYIFKGKPASYCGPGTQLNERCNPDCNENNLNPKDWSKEINEIDRIAHKHDHM